MFRVRLFPLFSSAGLVLAAVLAGIALATPVLESNGYGFTYTAFEVPAFSGFGFSSNGGGIAYSDMDGEDGAALLQAGLPVMVTGLALTVVGALVSLIPGRVGLGVGLAVGGLGIVAIIVAPILIVEGAGQATDGGAGMEDATAGTWLPIAGAAVAALSGLVGFVAQRITAAQPMPETAA